MTTAVLAPAPDPIPDRAFSDGWHHLRIETPRGGVLDLRGTDVRVESRVLYARLDTGTELDWPAQDVTSWTVRPAADR